jgi:hypothetical protein
MSTSGEPKKGRQPQDGTLQGFVFKLGYKYTQCIPPPPPIPTTNNAMLTNGFQVPAHEICRKQTEGNNIQDSLRRSDTSDVMYVCRSQRPKAVERTVPYRRSVSLSWETGAARAAWFVPWWKLFVNSSCIYKEFCSQNTVIAQITHGMNGGKFSVCYQMPSFSSWVHLQYVVV